MLSYIIAVGGGTEENGFQIERNLKFSAKRQRKRVQVVSLAFMRENERVSPITANQSADRAHPFCVMHILCGLTGVLSRTRPLSSGMPHIWWDYRPLPEN